MKHKSHNRSRASGPGRESQDTTGSDSGATSLLMRQITIGAFLFILGAALGVFLTSLPVRSRTPGGGSFSANFLSLAGIGSLTVFTCLLSSPLYVWLARRFPIYRQHWARNLALHFLITAALVMLTGAIYFRLSVQPTTSMPAPAEQAASQTADGERAADQPGRPPRARGQAPDLARFLLFRLLTESLPFWAMIALIHAFEFHRRYRRREFEAARLQTQLAESRLEALTEQLQPHFLFNTLQGISTLMHRDVNRADAMLDRLSDLLRQTLQRGDRLKVPLDEEMEILDNYVEIARERFKDRLVFETRTSSDARRALVPFFILQPLVENALQHGIARRAGVGRVEVSAERQGDTLRLSVTDDGPGLANGESDSRRGGVGLSNTRQRLRELYGGAQSLSLEAPEGGGLRVELIIPYEAAPVAESPEVES
ncbi:MAG TPA: histidine kinase [Blastocatellia bacterium]|nr:histidine kinase [Blastocatellia bacterium]